MVDASPQDPAAGRDERARRAALAAGAFDAWTSPEHYTYRSSGHLAIVGPLGPASEAAARLGAMPRCTVFATTGAPGDEGRAGEPVHAREVRARGYLGAFELRWRPARSPEAEQSARFDLLLDLGRPPLIAHELPPPGYLAPDGAEALEEALTALPALVGTFDKPRFVVLDAARCAHRRSGVTGCTRCLSVCPTGAIGARGEHVQIDPALCQGGGGCASACPSEAITYTLAPVEEFSERLRRALGAYREQGGEAPLLLFHGRADGAALLSDAARALPGRVLPVAVEEVASLGMEPWLAALAYGADAVLVALPASLAPSLRAEVERQIDFARAVLGGLGYDAGRVAAAASGAELATLAERESYPGIEPATFAAAGGKRVLMRLACEHLHAHAATPVQSTALPQAAAYGEIRVDPGACTLCMGCVSVCPAAALQAGGEAPRLSFIEANCVQCGLCAAACPERAIVLGPRILFSPVAARSARVLHAEAPFACVVCGKAFATQSMMRRMREKLSGHWMFQEPAALRRLQMCEDCRVRDLHRSRAGGGATGPGEG